MSIRGRRVAGIAVALAFAIGLWLLRGNTLCSLYFVTGWLLFFALGLDLYWRWQRSGRTPHVTQWIGVHAGLAVAATALFFLQLEFRVPNGWLESVLVLMFAGLLASGLFGVLIRLGLHLGLIDGAIQGPRLARRWVLLHVPLEASLVSLAVVHGVLVHAHSLMAHVMLGH